MFKYQFRCLLVAILFMAFSGGLCGVAYAEDLQSLRQKVLKLLIEENEPDNVKEFKAMMEPNLATLNEKELREMLKDLTEEGHFEEKVDREMAEYDRKDTLEKKIETNIKPYFDQSLNALQDLSYKLGKEDYVQYNKALDSGIKLKMQDSLEALFNKQDELLIGHLERARNKLLEEGNDGSKVPFSKPYTLSKDDYLVQDLVKLYDETTRQLEGSRTRLAPLKKELQDVLKYEFSKSFNAARARALEKKINDEIAATDAEIQRLKAVYMEKLKAHTQAVIEAFAVPTR